MTFRDCLKKSCRICSTRLILESAHYQDQEDTEETIEYDSFFLYYNNHHVIFTIIVSHAPASADSACMLFVGSCGEIHMLICVAYYRWINAS